MPDKCGVNTYCHVFARLRNTGRGAGEWLIRQRCDVVPPALGISTMGLRSGALGKARLLCAESVDALAGTTESTKLSSTSTPSVEDTWCRLVRGTSKVAAERAEQPEADQEPEDAAYVCRVGQRV